MRNWVSWFEIPVADLDRGRAFYEAIFADQNLKLQTLDIGEDLRMAMFPSTDREAVAGALCMHPGFYKPGHQGPLIYLNADPDLSHVLSKVEGAGGKVLLPKRLITEDYGHMAIIEDSEGNRIALWSSI